MRTFLSLLSVILFWPAYSPAQNAPADLLGEVSLQNVRFVDMNRDSLHLAVELSLQARDNVTIEGARLSMLRLNGLPVFAAPLNKPFELARGKTATLSPIEITIYLDDLSSLEPVRALLERQSAHVTGQLVVAPRIGFLGRLVLHSEHPQVFLAFAQDVPMVFASSDAARRAASAAVGLLQFGLDHRGLLQQVQTRDQWRRELESSAKASLVRIDSQYTLRERGAQTDSTVTLTQLGFRRGAGEVLTTAEALTPWSFDPEFQANLKRGNARLLADPRTFTLTQLGSSGSIPAPRPVASDAASLHPELRGTVTTETLILPEGRRENVDVSRRASPGAYAILHAPGTGAGLRPAPASVAAQGHWERVAVFCLTQPQGGTDGVEILQLSAERLPGDTGQIRLSRPLDASAFGSPVLTPEGLLAIVEDERTATLLPPR